MTRRNSVDSLNRLYASLTYLLPITAVVMFGVFLFVQFPPLLIAFFPVLKLNEVLSISIITITPGSFRSQKTIKKAVKVF